jgi:glycosyltransferase involved in cell wall biosynthesis
MSEYVIVSPVRNEEDLIEQTIKSVLNQTLRPGEWIIVNDGSTDRTREIVESYQKRIDWIRLVNVKDRGYYYPGTGVVNTVNRGIENISLTSWQFLVKLDCDITVDPDYFENLLNQFRENPKLGIASGAVFLKSDSSLVKEKSQYDHPWGASKIYRRECFNEIGGLKAIPGWDLSDLLAAQMKGWETRCFDDYKIIHYRESGSRRNGFTSGKFLLGRFLFRYGYNFLYTFLKGIYRMTERPYLIGGFSLIFGYIYAYLKNEEKLFDPEMRKFLRKKQFYYLKSKFKMIS